MWFPGPGTLQDSQAAFVAIAFVVTDKFVVSAFAADGRGEKQRCGGWSLAAYQLQGSLPANELVQPGKETPDGATPNA